ncbi:MAG: hypothetical protein EPO11_05640, partial [Gammaproteobacteria bacterium]
KTALLTHSHIDFILQRRSDEQGEHCDWWVTREASLVDVPGHYLSIQSSVKARRQKLAAYAVLWRFFLRLIRKYRGKQGIQGVVVALPLPDILQQGDLKPYQLLLRQIFQRFYELKKIFPHPLACYVVITKCDLLPGFSEFFGELGHDETTQSWGITLPRIKQGEKLNDLFTQRFDALIKRLNEQLLWRLHQERNPMARPAIKDFPLQMERVKELMMEFVKKLSASPFPLSLQGVYLTSALQDPTLSASTVVENTTNTAIVPIFNEPPPLSRAYFIKKLIAHGLTPLPAEMFSSIRLHSWKRNMAWTASAAAISFAAMVLGKDFEHGLKYTYSVHNQISDYQLAVQQFQNPDDHLIRTLALLDSLRKSVKDTAFKLDLSYIASFYSYKSYQKANLAYQQSLRSILLPEIRNYLQDYLKDPVNKNADTLYAVLKAYLMLGDPAHFQPDFILSTVHQLLPKSMGTDAINRLTAHLTHAFSPSIWQPLALDTAAIEETRKFLTSMVSLKLSYIILKSINNNDLETRVELGINEDDTIFTVPAIANEIPAMFTGQAFTDIFSQETRLAAEEATSGNWVLGDNPEAVKYPDAATNLTEQLRTMYVSNYVNIWEGLLANIDLSPPKTLAQTDATITELISDHSPLLQLLQALHNNTYFEPVT